MPVKTIFLGLPIIGVKLATNKVKAHVMVNHWGTILCKSPFPLNEYGSYYPENSMNYLGTTVSLQDWMNMSEVDFKEQQATENTMTMGGMG